MSWASHPERVAKLRGMRGVDASVGTATIASGFIKRVFSVEGKLTAQRKLQRRAIDYEKLAGRADAILLAGEAANKLQNAYSWCSRSAGVQVAQLGGPRAAFIGAAITSLATAGSYLASNDQKNPFKYQNAQAVAAADAQRIGNIQSSSAEDQKINNQIRAIQVAAAKNGVNLDLGR